MRLEDLPESLQDQIRSLFGVGGHCGCDGALDFGCPLCSDKQLEKWLVERALEAPCVEVIGSPSVSELKGMYFPILDHGFVSLVDVMGDDAAIAQAARVSYGAGNRNVRDNQSLIRYLYSHRHTSPLEMVELKFHCKMPIFVARQWIRHRTANVNEMSGRYSIMPLQMYTPDKSVIRAQSIKNKQGRDEELDASQVLEYLSHLEHDRIHSKETYVTALKSDIARELCRIDLPLSLYTEWYWKIDLHNLLHYLSLRCDGHAQWEIQQYANVMAGMVKAVAPAAYGAWIDYRYCAVTLSRMDRLLLDDSNQSGDSPTLQKALDLGMTKREWEEFQKKMTWDPDCVPNHELNPLKAKSAEYFLERAREYVPNIESSGP